MKSLLFFGDSIMAGKGLPAHKSYVHQIEHGLKTVYPEQITILNLAIPGSNTKDILRHLKTQYDSKTNKYICPIVIFGVGINDAKQNTNKAEFIKNWQLIFKHCKKITNTILVIGLTPVQDNLANQYGFYTKEIKKYNNILKKLCAINQIAFVPCLKILSIKDQANPFLSDGIHLNTAGHKILSKNITPALYSLINNSYDQRKYLKSIFPTLKNKDFKFLKDQFQPAPQMIQFSNLFFGIHNYLPKTQATMGGACIRKDFEGISLNTFYQIFMPIYVAKALGVSSIIFLGIEEEIVLRPKKAKKFTVLAASLITFIQNIATEIGVEVIIKNTNDKNVNQAIKKAVVNNKIKMSPFESTNIFSIIKSPNKTKELHSLLRTSVTERIIACHFGNSLKEIVGKKNILIVEDLEQFGCYKFTSKLKQKNNASFLSLLPLPDITSTSTMFKADSNERILLGQSADYYKQKYQSLAPQTNIIYLELCRLYNLAKNNVEAPPIGQNYFIDTMLRISKLLN